MPLKNLNVTVLSILLICNVLLFVELSDSNQKLQVLYLAQERAELSASLWLEKGQLLEKEKRYREAQDAYHKAQRDQRTTVAGKAERALYRSRANEIIDNPTNLDPSTMSELTRTLRAQGDTQIHLATALDVLQFTEGGQLQKAVELMSSLYDSPKLGEKMCIYLGQRMLQNRATAKAVKLLSSCVESMPKAAQAWVMLARAFQANDQPEEGTKAMKQSLAIEPNPQINIELSRSLMASKKWQAAIDRLSVFPQDATLRAEHQRLIGACYFQLKDYAQAAASYQAAYDSQPNPKTLLSKVIALRSGGLSKDALSTLDQLTSHEKALPEIRFQRGQLLAEAGDMTGAAQAFTGYVQLARGRNIEKSRLTSAQSWLLKYRQPQARPAPQTPPLMPVKNTYQGAPSTVPSQR